jgi:signal transduction histidine kinase
MVNDTTDRLTALVEELFLLARADNRQHPLRVEDIDLSKVLTRDAGKLMARAVQKEVALHLDAPESLPIQGDEAKLSRLFMNLIDNGIKYSRPGDEVTVALSGDSNYACVTITDTGPGIPPEHLPHLFERFYRVDKARSRSTLDANGSGAGLGLSIAHWLAELHGGRIQVTSKVGQGSTFEVWLPLEQPQAEFEKG